VTLRFSRAAALATGVFLPALETWRRWGSGTHWSAWTDDYIAAGLLLYAWNAGRSLEAGSRPYLMAAWGYTLGIAYMSFFGHLRTVEGTDVSGFPNRWAIAFKGFGLAFALFNLAAAWRAKPSAITKSAVSGR
jgi:hypothetical protein